jgi:hypothetical protein
MVAAIIHTGQFSEVNSSRILKFFTHIGTLQLDAGLPFIRHVSFAPAGDGVTCLFQSQLQFIK